jgi:His-Xaa-Ser system protein HxsD
MRAPSDGLVLDIDLRVFRLTAVKKVAYAFGDRFCVQIESSGEERVRVVLSPKVALPSSSDVCGEFRNALIDQDLRDIVAEETEPVRNVLLAHAFSKAALIDPELETADFRSEGIVTVPPPGQRNH